MHIPKNYQFSTKKKYCSMNFIAINFKISIIINNYISYNILVF